MKGNEENEGQDYI